MAFARHIAALRSRLLTDPELMGILNNNPTRIYPRFVFDVHEPLYPCITMAQVGGQDAVQFPRTYDPVRVQFDCYVSGDDQPEQCMQMTERIFDLLHAQKNRCSTSDACFHEIRRIDEGYPAIDDSTNAWRQTSIYLIRATVR